LKPPPYTVRLFLLDENLRQRTGGLRDISARQEERAALDLPVSRVYIVENLLPSDYLVVSASPNG
jgi:hypothetical protein